MTQNARLCDDMDVYWLEQTEADVPADSDWLSVGEAACQNRLHIAKRRADWRLGRWTAKRAVAAYLNVSGHRQDVAEIEIRPALSGAPEAFVANKPVAVALSLSHRDGVAVCAIAPTAVALGCDVELIEPHSDAFITDYFTAEEQALLMRFAATDRARLPTLLWSAKESALKALRVGLRLDTRCVTVVPFLGPTCKNKAGGTDFPDSGFRQSIPDSWHPLLVRCAYGQVFNGWWRQTSSFLRTVVSAPPPVSPIPLG